MKQSGRAFGRKRMLSLCAALLLGMLSACGTNAASTAAGQPAGASPAAGAEQDAAATAIVWEETTADISGLGYATEAYEGIGLSDCSFQLQDGAVVAYQTDGETCAVQSFSLDGVLQCEADLVYPDDDYQLSSVQFTEDNVYALFTSFEATSIEDTGSSDYLLRQYTTDGTLAWEKSLRQIIEESAADDAGTFSDFVALEDRILVATEEHIFRLSLDGQVQSVSDGAGMMIEFCRTGTGRLFVKCAFTVYDFDMETDSVGQEAFALSNGESVLPGNEPYDFLLLSDTRLRGVELDARRITELLSWQDCNLTSSVTEVLNLTDTQYLVSAYETIQDTQLLLLSLLPEDQLPQKETVKMAVASYDEGESYSLDTQTIYAVNAFNRASKDYHIEITTYSSAQDLQLLMLTDTPDLIVFNYALEDPPSSQLYAEKGYLADLTPFLEADPELRESDLLPNIVQAFRSETSGLWTLPNGFYVTTQYISREYVEQMESWDTSGLYHLMQSLPDEYSADSYREPSLALSEFLEHCIDTFVDIPAKTCDFTQTSFYELLYLCRDYCGEDGTPLISTVMLNGMGTSLTEEASLLRDDVVYVGYPGASGNGSAINCPYLFSITSYGKNQDGAWSFLRTLFLPKYQNQTSIFFPVNQASFAERIESCKAARADAVDPAEFDALAELVLGATSCESLCSPVADIVIEEAAAFFNGDKSAEAVAEIIQNRVNIYLWEQS